MLTEGILRYKLQKVTKKAHFMSFLKLTECV